MTNSRQFNFSGALVCDSKSFDGTNNVDFNITALNSSYLNWGSVSADSLATVKPLDIAINPALNQNRLSFMPAKDIKIYGSSDGKKYNVVSNISDSDKVSLVTTGLSKTLSIENLVGKTGKGMGVSITASRGELYFSLKKIMINVGTNGANGSKVNVVTIDFNGVSSDAGTYNLHGWSGWNAITLNRAFGQSGSSQKSHIKTIVLTFTATEDTVNNTQSKLTIYNIAMFGENCWSASGGDLPKWGHLYKYDVDKNVSFPARLEVGKMLTAESIKVTGDSNIRNMTALNIDPESSNGIIGKADNKWSEIYVEKLHADEVGDRKVTNVNAAQVTTGILQADEFDISTIKHVTFQDNMPSAEILSPTPKTKSTSLTYTISRKANTQQPKFDPAGNGRTFTIDNICNITLHTSELARAQGNIIDVNLGNICVPIGLTYVNDYDTHGALWWKWKAWASVYVQNVTLTFYQGSTIVGSTTLNSYTTTCYQEYSSYHRNCAVYYPKTTNFKINDLSLGSWNNGYKDITLKVKLSYTIIRNDGGDYKDCYNTRVDYIYTPGLYTSTYNPAPYNAKFVFNTSTSSSAISGKMSLSSLNDNGKITASYTINSTVGERIYMTKEGICISRGRSALFIVPPKDGDPKVEDNFGYIEVRQYNNTKMPGETKVLKKSLLKLLS